MEDLIKSYIKEKTYNDEVEIDHIGEEENELIVRYSSRWIYGRETIKITALDLFQYFYKEIFIKLLAEKKGCENE
jgi:hypothetical protein